ncbi:MAG TPA: hypothetical protein VHZ03_01840 [Trebonia sp.]|nr:hypothetical protein [Trebonia sp.]
MENEGGAADAGRFATVVIDDYAGPYPNLPEIREHANRVLSLLAKLGFEPAAQPYAPAEETAAGVKDWLDGLRSPGRRLLFYWAGHASRRREDDLWLYCQDTGDPPSPATAIGGSDLGEFLAEQSAREIVLILDACHSGIGINAIVSAFRGVTEKRAYPGRRPSLAVISSASSYQAARERVFAPALVTILQDGPPEPSENYAGWTSRDALITPNDLADAIEEHLKRNGSRQAPDYLQSRTVGGFFPFLPNLAYRPGQSDVTVESRRRGAFADNEMAEHFLVKFRGIDADGADGADGWFFAGRVHPLRTIVTWLRIGSGMLVITGPPGSGKSAIMGHLAVLSVPAYRRLAEDAGALADADPDTLPAPNSISAGVHAKGKTLLDCVTDLASALDIAAPARGWEYPGQFVAAVRDLGRPLTVLLDALDEAYLGDRAAIAADLLRPLSQLPGVKILVGTRPSLDDPAAADVNDPLRGSGAIIRDLTQDPGQVIHLESDPGGAAAIADYVAARLARPSGSPYRGHPDRTQVVAATVAGHSQAVFLFARLIARALAGQPAMLDLSSKEARELLSGGVADAFAADLDRYGSDRRRVADFLAPLAWAEGAGLPRRQVWLALTNALADGTPAAGEYTDGDLAWVLENAGAHIVESGEDGQTVYRLYHRAFSDYFRCQRDPTDVQARIARALATLAGPA